MPHAPASLLLSWSRSTYKEAGLTSPASIDKEVVSMRRLLLVLVVAALMVTMAMATAVEAFAIAKPPPELLCRHLDGLVPDAAKTTGNHPCFRN
jgi:hypothetical protein